MIIDIPVEFMVKAKISNISHWEFCAKCADKGTQGVLIYKVTIPFNIFEGCMYYPKNNR